MDDETLKEMSDTLDRLRQQIFEKDQQLKERDALIVSLTNQLLQLQKVNNELRPPFEVK